MKSLIARLIAAIRGTSRAERIFAIVLLVIFVGHFATRVFVPRDSSHRQFKEPSFAAVSAAPSSADLQARLTEWTPAVEAPKLREPDLFLRAVVIQGGVGRAAVSVVPHDGQAAKLVWVKMGDSIEGWNVMGIAKNELELQRDEQRRDLRIFVRE
jgi:hypothetical protein